MSRRPTPAQDRVLAALTEHGTLAYTELMRLTDMVQSGVRKALLALERAGKVERIKIGPPARRVGKHYDERVRIAKVFWRRV